MRIRWTEEAANDLEGIADYLFLNTPEHAPRIVRTIYNSPSSLAAFPSMGRRGKKTSTRELTLSPLPYVLVYEVDQDVIHILRILHGARKWP